MRNRKRAESRKEKVFSSACVNKVTQKSNKHYKPLFEDHQPCGYETMEEYIKATEYKLSLKDTVKEILSFIKHNNISQENMTIFNKILGDRALLKKIVFCTDGSYRNNRIFYKGSFSVKCEWLYENKHDSYFDMNKKDKLKFIKNNYEVVYLHLVTDYEVEKERLWDDFFGYGDFYDC